MLHLGQCWGHDAQCTMHKAPRAQSEAGARRRRQRLRRAATFSNNATAQGLSKACTQPGTSRSSSGSGGDQPPSPSSSRCRFATAAARGREVWWIDRAAAHFSSECVNSFHHRGPAAWRALRLISMQLFSCRSGRARASGEPVTVGQMPCALRPSSTTAASLAGTASGSASSARSGTMWPSTAQRSAPRPTRRHSSCKVCVCQLAPLLPALLPHQRVIPQHTLHAGHSAGQTVLQCSMAAAKPEVRSECLPAVAAQQVRSEC